MHPLSRIGFRRPVAVCCFALWLAAVVAPTRLLGQTRPGKKYAVLIGVNHYQHDKLATLQYAEADIVEMARVLREAGYQVTMLIGSATDAALKPTKTTIDKEVAATLRACEKGDVAIIAFAGHGVQFEKRAATDADDAYFCPVDARPFRDEAASLVSIARVYQELDRSFAGMKVLFVDACRDDPDAARGSRGGLNADSAPRPPYGVAALYSCRAGERAFEHQTLGHGLFFYHVLKGLEGQAKDKRGRVTFARLAAYVCEEVCEGDNSVAKLYGGAVRQSPHLMANYSTEPVLLSLRVPEPAPAPAPSRTALDSGGRELAARSKSPIRWRPTAATPITAAGRKALTKDTGGREYHNGDVQDVQPNGVVLTGLRISEGTAWGGSVVAIQPIYETPTGQRLGRIYGAPERKTTDAVAKPGYAVGGVECRSGLVMDGLVVVFMKIKDGRLDVSDAYRSRQFGKNSGGNPAVVLSNGRIIRGVTGAAGGAVGRIGFVFAEAASATGVMSSSKAAEVAGAAPVGPPGKADDAAKGPTADLLKLIRLPDHIRNPDAVSAKKTPEGLYIDSDRSKFIKAGSILVPYAPPEEYDLRMTYTCHSEGTLGPIFETEKMQASFLIGSWGTKAEVHRLDGAGGVEKNVGMAPAGSRNTVLVRVRKSGIAFYNNDELIGEWTRGMGRFSLDARLGANEPRAIGIAVWPTTDCTVNSFELQAVSTPGTELSF